MKTWIFLLAVIGFASCKPEPGFLRDVADILGQRSQRSGLSAFARSLLDAVSQLNASGSAKTKDRGTVKSGVISTLVRGDTKAAGTLLDLKMPPKKDGDAMTEDKKKARKKNKPRKKKDVGPSRIRKTDRIVLNKQARDIIAKVYDFMKREALAEYAEKLSNARWRTATAVGVSEKTVSRILKDRNKKLTEGSALAGTGAVFHGKLEALHNTEQAVGNVLTGNFSAAAHNLGNAVGDVIRGDLGGASIIGSGAALAGGQIIGAKLQAADSFLATGTTAAGQMAAGKLGAATDIASGLNSLATSDLMAARAHFGDAVGSVIAGDAAGVVSTIFGAL